MATYEHSAPQTRAAGSPSSIQRTLSFDWTAANRNPAELLLALSRSLLAATGRAPEPTLNDSLLHAVAGLGAEKGVLVQVRQEHPTEVEIVCSAGLTAEDEEACLHLRSSAGLNGVLIRKAIDEAQPVLIESTAALDGEDSPPARSSSVICASVMDSLSGAVAAVLYFQDETSRVFSEQDREWLTAYVAALGQAWTMHGAGRRRIPELEGEWRRSHDANGPEIIGESDATRQLGQTLNILLPSTTRQDAPAILVTGESGTGKELVARYLHHYSPKRSRGPFQAFNCAGLRGDLAEAKLFGHVRGAFTGAVSDAPGLFRAAHNGVLLLDEVGELPLDGQALLLRALETRTVQPVGETKTFPVDVQIILATNRKLEEEVAAKRFREDLYYRVCGLQVELVPLRDPRRLSDIRVLLAYYLAKHERALRKKTMGLTRDALRTLLHYSWPGNVRQLSNVCLCLVTHAPPGAWIDVADIRRLQPEVVSGLRNLSPEAYLQNEEATYSEALRAFRKQLIFDRLRRHGSSAIDAAASLKISGPTFYRYWADAKRFP